MVLKITDLRKQYGLDPTFETEEEALAYQQERQAAYQERVAAKVQELKDRYNSDKEKYAQFSKFKEEDWVEYAKICLASANARQTKFSFNSLPSVDKNPEVAKWAGYTYEEILQMESDGVLIPNEVLTWAHSMQDSDVTAYEINDDAEAVEETTTTGTNSENSELKELQKKTQTLSNKSENTQVQIEQNFDSFKELADKAEQIKKEQETTKKDSLKQIEELTKEWEEISAKIKKGDKLTESEQKRYKELGSMLNGKDGSLVTDIQASSDDLQALMNSMDGLNEEITTSIELGDNTVELAKQLSRYEKGYTRKETISNEVIDVTTGDIKNALQSSEGKDIAENALNIGTNLIEFSNTLSTQLMMNQYASLYDFAEIFTQTSTETLTNTKEVLGDDFNKTTEELNEQIDELPDMTNAENDQARLEEKGVGIVGQALFFTGKSQGETLKSLVSMLALVLIQRQSEKETEKSQDLTDVVVEKMTSKKEEADKLTEKKEKAEENKNESEKAIENAAIEDETNLEEAQKTAQNSDEEEFTEEDKKTLDKLNNELQKTGNLGQQKLYQSLSKVDSLGQTMNSKKLDGANAVDYGTVTQEVGQRLIDQMSPLFILKAFFYLIVAMAVTAGKVSENIGNENNELFEETSNTTKSGKSSIGQNQLSIQETTAVEAINLVSTSQGENNSAQAETTDDTNAAAQTSDAAENTTSTDTTVEAADVNKSAAEDTRKAATNIPTAGETTLKDATDLASTIEDKTENTKTSKTSKTSKNNTSSSSSKSKDAEDMSKDEALSQSKTQMSEADKSNKQVKDANTEAKDAQKESQKVNKDSAKTEKEIERQMKNLDKQNEKDTKDIEKLAKDSEKAQQEQIALAAEFEVLNTQNEEIIANQQSKQNQAAAPAAAPTNAEQGGLLSNQQITSSTDNGDQATLDANNTRIQSIASRFTVLDAKITTNRTKITQKTSSINTRTRKFQKLAKQKLKLQKAAEKKEKQKQRKMAVANATLDMCNSVFSVVTAVGTIISMVAKIMGIVAKTLQTNPYTLAAGIALEITSNILKPIGKLVNKIGTIGTAACGIAKAVVAAATGDIKGALVTLGTTIISIATSMAGGGGGDGGSIAQAALQITSATSSMVSSTANAVGAGQTLAGKEKSKSLTAISQIAGLVSTATSVASGFVNGGPTFEKDSASGLMKMTASKTPSAFASANTFGKVMQVAQATGTGLSMSAQISTIIKQANGKDPGQLEKILNTAGFSISTAASLGQIGLKIQESASKGKENTDSNNTAEKEQENKNEKVDKKDKDNIEKTDKTDKKVKEEDKKSNTEADEIASQPADANASDTLGTENTKTEAEQKTEEIIETIDETDAKIDSETKQELKNAQTTETNDEINNENKLAKWQERIIGKTIAKTEGLKVGKPQVIGENSFEITSDGQYLVNGKRVGMDNFMTEIKTAKNTDNLEAVTEQPEGVVEAQDANDAASENNENNSQETASANPENIPATETPGAEENSDLAAVDEIVTELDENTEAANLDQAAAEIEAAASQDPQETVLANQDSENESIEKLERPENNLNEVLDEEVQRALSADEGDIIKPEQAETMAEASEDPQEVILNDQDAEQAATEDEPKDLQDILDEEMQRALTADNGEIIQPERQKSEAQIKFERQQKMDKAMDIGSTVLEAGSQGLQAYSAIKSLGEQPEQEASRNVLHLSNMKKGKSLIRKIKKRRAALYGYAIK